MNEGRMPNTDFTYEEFEGLLTSFYLSLLSLRESDTEDDRRDFETALGILNGFAERHGVQKPEEAAAHPRATEEEWGQPEKFGSYCTLMDMMGSFWRDFGVGADSKELDGEERCKLGRLLLGVLHRRGVIRAKFEELDGESVAVGIEGHWPSKRAFQSIA